MNKYYCDNCKLILETSKCPVCGRRTKNIDEVFWSFEFNIPVINPSENFDSDKLKYISTDIRPVFPEERLLVELILDKPLKYIDSSCWSTTGGTYIFDGKKIRIKMRDLRFLDDKDLREKYLYYQNQNTFDAFQYYSFKFVEINKARCNALTSEAIEYIQKIFKDFDFNSTFISFSGGKDSTVVSDLVMKALGTPKIIHIFGDTTLEFPETYDYIQKFRKEHRFTPVLNTKNKEKNFNDLCEVIGPPSRVMRWCCTVFKTGAMVQYINTMYNKKNRVLTFYGIRRSESLNRNKYDRESDSPKISKQYTASPIIDWLDVDVWLYILSNNLYFNEAYRLGFTRVGCWCCPNNSRWSEFLSRIHHPEDYYKFKDILIENAIKIGKPDPEEYVESGAWKAKQGGEGLEYSQKRVITFEPCATEENAFNYELQKPINNNLYELFKPFGDLNFELGNRRIGEVYVLDKNKRVLLKLKGRIGDKLLKISIINLPVANCKTIKEVEQKIKCQLTKFQMCINCTGCMSACRFGAIKITYKNGELKYKVNEEKCVHCYECINHFTGGCYIRKVVMVKDKRQGKINENKI